MEDKLNHFVKNLQKKGFFKANLADFPLNKTEKGGYAMIVDNPVLSGVVHDASHFHLYPQIIFIPLHVNQLKEIILASQKYNVSVTFAGGKTGLSGGYANNEAIVDMSLLRSLDKPIEYHNETPSECKWVKVDQNVKVSTLISMTNYNSKGYLLFPIQPSSSHNSPVTVGGIISTNASGLTSGKLGPTRDWVKKIEIMTPTGEIRTLSKDKNLDLFDKIVGGMGYYGAVLNASLYLKESVPDNELKCYVLYGDDVSQIYTPLQEIQEKTIFPLNCEFLMTPHDKGLKEVFQSKLKNNINPKWVILIKGSDLNTTKFNTIFEKHTVNHYADKLNYIDFKKFLKKRSQIAILTLPVNDDISNNSENYEYVRYPGFEDILIQPKQMGDVFHDINEIINKKALLIDNIPIISKIFVGYGHLNFRRGKGVLLHVRLPVKLDFLTIHYKTVLAHLAEIIAHITSHLVFNYNILPKAEHTTGILTPWVMHILHPEKLQKWREDIDNAIAFNNPHLTNYLQLIGKNSLSPSLKLDKSDAIKILTQLLRLYLH